MQHANSRSPIPLRTLPRGSHLNVRIDERSAPVACRVYNENIVQRPDVVRTFVMSQQRVLSIEHVPGETAERESRPSLDEGNIYTGLSKAACCNRSTKPTPNDDRPVGILAEPIHGRIGQHRTHPRSQNRKRLWRLAPLRATSGAFNTRDGGRAFWQ
jgi:hypothetical protein